MKKRILGLALCLVMIVSLLPVTAAAADPLTITSVAFSVTGLDADKMTVDGMSAVVMSADRVLARDDPDYGYYLELEMDKNESGLSLRCSVFPKIPGSFIWPSDLSACSISVPGYTSALEDLGPTESHDGTNKGFLAVFHLEEGHRHAWSYDISEAGDKLTATCLNSGCPFGTVSVKLTAQSVTLPYSPFKAKVEVSENFTKAFPNAVISGIRYDYQDAEGVWHDDIEPTAANAKAGQYQAGVSISGLPADQGVAVMAMSNDDGTNQGGQSVFLFVKYTAVDPAVTAQTGDNRPIELMMAGVLVFSVLAAAAFIADSKRKYSR